jgi:plastocyanin
MLRAWRIVLPSVLGILTAAAAQAANHVATVTGTFSPQVLTIRIGDTVTWSNSTTGFHNVFSDDGTTFSSGSAAAGPWSFSFTFTATGTFGYHCQPHGSPGSGQFGTIIVIEAIEVGHGSEVYDDLNGAPDRYRISQSPYSSYEIVVDAVAGDPSLAIARTDAAGAALQSSLNISTIAMTQSLRWVNPAATGVDSQRLRITNGHCATAATTCTANDGYRLRAYETTYAIPRYNQSGSQVSVVILQNPTDYTITGFVYFWNAGGTLLNAPGHAFSLSAKTVLVLSASSIPSLAGTSGTVTVAHTGRYGDLAGKVVALEPATGFSFDSMMVPRVK